MSAALCALSEVTSRDPKPYKNVIPSFVSILKQVDIFTLAFPAQTRRLMQTTANFLARYNHAYSESMSSESALQQPSKVRHYISISHAQKCSYTFCAGLRAPPAKGI